MLYNISLKADNRVAFFNQIKNNDYDCVKMSHDQFSKIPQSPEMQQQILQAELDSVEENLEVLKQQAHNVSSFYAAASRGRRLPLTDRMTGQRWLVHYGKTTL